MEVLFPARYRFGWRHHLLVCLVALSGFLFYWYGTVRSVHPGHRDDIWVSLIINILLFYVNFLFLWPLAVSRGRWKRRRVAGIVLGNLVTLIVLSLGISMVFGDLELEWEGFEPSDVLSLVDGSIQNYAPYAFPNLLSLVASLFAFRMELIYPMYANRGRILREFRQVRMAWRRAQLDPHLLDTHLLMLSVIARASKATAQAALEHTIRVVQFYIGGNDPQQPVRLVDEIGCIRHMIEIQRIRFGDTLNWRLEVEERSLTGVFVIPMVVMPLAENMTRYAVLNDAEAPAIIRVRLIEGDLWVTSENRVRIENGRTGSGTGLSNLAERLRYAYPHGSRVRAWEAHGRFYTEVVIAGTNG